MYYHRECYDKQSMKRKIRDILISRKMVQRDINIMLKRAIDDEEYNLDYIYYVVINKQDEIRDPYKVLYQLKIDTNYKEYEKIYKTKQQLKINQYIKTQEIDNNGFSFDINTSKAKRFKIY